MANSYTKLKTTSLVVENNTNSATVSAVNVFADNLKSNETATFTKGATTVNGDFILSSTTSRKFAANGAEVKIGTVTNHGVNFIVNNAPNKLYIASNGNVGINTGTPEATLHVNGNIIANDTLTNNNGETVQLDQSTNSVKISTTSNADTLTVKSGNVGIGQINPATKLEVTGDVHVTGNILGKNTSNNEAFGVFQNTNSIDSVGYLNFTADGIGGGDGITRLGGRTVEIVNGSTGASAGTTVLYATGDKIGIGGIPDDSYRFKVHGGGKIGNHTIDTHSIELNKLTTGVNDNVYIDFHNKTNQDYTARIIQWADDNNSKPGALELTNLSGNIQVKNQANNVATLLSTTGDSSFPGGVTVSKGITANNNITATNDIKSTNGKVRWNIGGNTVLARGPNSNGELQEISLPNNTVLVNNNDTIQASNSPEQGQVLRKTDTGIKFANARLDDDSIAGTLPEDQGGTGKTSYTNGQLLIGNNNGGLTKSTLTAGDGITITNASGSITLAHTSHTGDVTGSTSTTISNDAVSNAKLANMPGLRIKGRKESSEGDPQDLTAAEVRSLLNVADGANQYIHPTHTTRNVTATGINVLDTFTSDALGHVTDITTRTLQSASNTQSGVVNTSNQDFAGLKTFKNGLNVAASQTITFENNASFSIRKDGNDLKFKDNSGVGEKTLAQLAYVPTFEQDFSGIVPIGGIIMWSGTTVPTGWALCNGQGTTPNLVNKFILGSTGTTTAPTTNSTGGSNTQTITINNLPHHTHTSGNYSIGGGDHSHSLRADTGANASGATGSTVNRVNASFHNVDNHANSNYAAAKSVGSSSNELGVTLSGSTSNNAHNHNFTGSSGNIDTSSVSGNMGQSISIVPAYYALAFIQRVS